MSAALTRPLTKETIGLLFFMGTVTSLFSLFISAYLTRMGLTDWSALAEPRQLWINTAMLIISSACLMVAQRAARFKVIRKIKTGLLLAGLFAFAFLLGQIWVWQQLQVQELFLASNPANSFFYLITGLHGLHLLGGLTVWGVTCIRVWNGFDRQQSIRLCAWYWHFLLLLWLVLFGLFLMT